jgi:transposase
LSAQRLPGRAAVWQSNTILIKTLRPNDGSRRDDYKGRFKRIGLEAGPLSQWLFSALAEAELPVICVETRHMQAVLEAQINKTDRNDARGRCLRWVNNGPRGPETPLPVCPG